MSLKTLDLSIGDALRPMTHVARVAFAEVAAMPLNRYVNAPTNTGGSAARPLSDAQAAMSDFTTAMGWKRPGYSGQGYGYGCFAFFDGGVTRAFDLVLQALAEKKKPKPVIIMPVPTYGYFITMAEKRGFEVITIVRDVKNGGALDLEKLRKILRKTLKDGKTVMGYYDASPNNPLGFIRSREETDAVGRLMFALRKRYEKLTEKEDGAQKKRWRSWDQERPYPVVIDDQVYRGLHYDGRATIPTFSQVTFDSYYEGTRLDKQAITLLGPSKIGLSGLRVGIAAGTGDWIADMKHLSKQQAYFPSYTTLAVIRELYDPKSGTAARTKRFLARLNADHRFNGLLMKALINGMDTMPELTDRQRDRLIRVVRRHRNCSEAKAVRELKRGIRGAKILTTPTAGFFHILDLSTANRFKSWRTGMNLAQVTPERQREMLARPNKDMRRSLGAMLSRDFHVHTASMAWAGLKDERENMARVTFAIPRADIFEFVDRLRQASKLYYALPQKQGWAILEKRLMPRAAA